MDREELDERIRGRRPGDPAFRRGIPVDDAAPEPPRPSGYVPFEPEPEDQLAAREADQAGAPRYVDNTPEGFDAGLPPPRQALPPPPPVSPVEPPPEAYRPHVPEPAAEEPPAAEPPAEEPPAAESPAEEPPAYVAPPPYAAPSYEHPPYEPPAYSAPEPPAYDDSDYQPTYEPDDAYPYPYAARDDGGRRGGGALPIIGFIALCALALAVGAVLAGILGGTEPVGQASPTPTVAPASATAQPSASASVDASAPPSASATPEPTDGPVTFADGAIITVQPCATRDMSFDGCDEDGSVVDGDVWVWIGFEDALGSDTFTLGLRNADETIHQQDRVLGEILDCPDRCSGYLIGAAYQDLDPGDYVLVVRRNGDFADRADFLVED